MPIEFEENWSVEQCRKIAADIALHMVKDQTAIGAFDGEGVIGFITVSHNIFGNTAKGRKGAIGVLTNGRIYRDELEEYAVIMALTKIVSKEVYEN